MSERSKILQQLLAHAVICEEAASLSWNEEIAAELEKLAIECRQAVFDLAPEVPSFWKH